MNYYPPYDLEKEYINPFGFDRREINHKLPSICRSWEIKDFLNDPYDVRGAIMQKTLYQRTLLTYIESLAHVLNTGKLHNKKY